MLTIVDFDKRMETLKQAKNNILKAQKKQKKDYDRKHFCPKVYDIGSIVLKRDFTGKKRKGGKLDSKWVGPYKIIRNLKRGLYKLEDMQDPSKIVSQVNGIHLKKYVQPKVRSHELHANCYILQLLHLFRKGLYHQHCRHLVHLSTVLHL